MRSRRQWLMVGGSIAAVVIGVLGTVAIAGALRDRTSDAPADAVASNEPTGAALTDLDWYAVQGTVGPVRSMHAAADGTVYALSTMPGGRNIGPPEPAIYASGDGADWDVLPIAPDIYAGDMAVRGDHLYLIGTAPANAALGGDVAVNISATDDFGRSWEITELPIEAKPPDGLAVHWYHADTEIAAGAGGVLAVVATSFEVDLRSLVPADLVGPGRDVVPSPTGVDIIDFQLVEEMFMRCEGFDIAEVEPGVPVTTVAPGALPDNPDGEPAEIDCQALLEQGEMAGVVDSLTWDELGLDASQQPRFTEAFFSVDGTTFEPVDVDFSPGQPLAGLYAAGDRFFAAEQNGVLWESPDGRSWSQVDDVPAMTWVQSIQAVGDDVVLIGDARNRPVVAWAADGSWNTADLDPLLDEYGLGQERWVSAAGAGALGAVLVVQSWSEGAIGPESVIVVGRSPDEWDILPVEGLLPDGNEMFASWVFVGDESVLVSYTGFDGRGSQAVQLVGVVDSA